MQPFNHDTSTHTDILPAFLRLSLSGGPGTDWMTLSRSPQPQDPCNVFVKYLPQEINDQALYNLFSPFGSIISSKVMVDSTGNSMGYGFVRFSTPSEAQVSIAAMNGQQISSKRLMCKLSNPSSTGLPSVQSPSTNLYIRSLLPSTTEEHLRQMFSPFGKVIECKVMIDKATGLSRQIGFVRFSSESESLKAIKSMNGVRLDPNYPALSIKYADNESQRESRRARQLAQFNLQQYYSHVAPTSTTTIYTGYSVDPYTSHISPNDIPLYYTYSPSPPPPSPTGYSHPSSPPIPGSTVSVSYSPQPLTIAPKSPLLTSYIQYPY